MKRLYPDTSSYMNGYLDTEDGYSLYYEQSGAPDGIPVLYLHGGPGAGLSPNYKSFFDANRYRIIAFEQRGCGRSQPFGSLTNNTTAHSLEDIQRLRQHLGIEQWVLFGGSWGATLALLSAIQHPHTVRGMVLRGVFLGRQEDREWFLGPNGGAAHMFPEYYRQFIQGIDSPSVDSICQHYHNAFRQKCELSRVAALKRWYLWEERLSRLVLPPGTGEFTAHYPVPLMTSLAKLECHYLINRCFIENNYILDNIHRIATIPATVIHGRYDMICKLEGADTLVRGWPAAQLQIVADCGHSTSEPGIAHALCRATRDMARFIEENST
ncbi:prolyl aminopeptidase [Alteromonas aestuariivivens]|uniref:Proline iminopeptidase n=1 Tax=Alteromonas aestuariivivens TaxID=1938339 RepID=A0A3D8M3J5_9ALTE|nr:prolyl aminopeptidase [Alteromonas aestuariivivens]RDV24188.1 prolyl aminopeptidase [Alteromonas aestuariivivens]